jgi:uncharacterized protein YceK
MTTSVPFRLAFALPLLLAGCSSVPPTRFMHQQHREAYAMEQADLEELQFYVSTKVIAHELDASGPQSVVLVEAGTPGLAVASGPRWIRVRFQEGGDGVVFLADPTARADSQYTLATEVEGGGYQLVRLTKNRILQTGGRRFLIVEGTGAHLLVDSGTLKKVIGERRQVEGQRLDED